MNRDIGLKGGRELMQFLDAFPDRLRKGALRSAIVAAAAEVREQARANAPKKSGQMAKAIKTGSPRLDEQGNVRVRVRLAGKHSFLGMFIEYGVRPHFIQAGDSGLSPRKLTQRLNREGGGNADGGAMKIGGSFVAGAVLHPGIPARPFLRPALDQAGDAAIKAFGDRLRSYLKDKASFTAPVVLEVDD